MKKPQTFFTLTLDTTDNPGDAPVLFDVYLSMNGIFPTTPSVKSVPGVAVTKVAFANNEAAVARYIKLVIINNKPSVWWSIQELTVGN